MTATSSILLNVSDVSTIQYSGVYTAPANAGTVCVCVLSTVNCTTAGAGAPLTINVEDPTSTDDITSLTGATNATSSTAVVGVGTLFTAELSVGDTLILDNQRRTVTAITDDTNCTVSPAFTGAAADTTPQKEAFTAVQFTQQDVSANTLLKVVINGSLGSRMRCNITPDAAGNIKIWAWGA